MGAQRAFGELGYWSLRAELYYNDAGSTATTVSPSLAAAGTFSPFYAGALYSYAALTRAHLFADGVSATLAGFVDFSDLSFLSRFSTTIGVPGIPSFTFSLGWAGGGANKASTYITGNDSLSADLRMKVEF